MVGLFSFVLLFLIKFIVSYALRIKTAHMCGCLLSTFCNAGLVARTFFSWHFSLKYLRSFIDFFKRWLYWRHSWQWLTSGPHIPCYSILSVSFCWEVGHEFCVLTLRVEFFLLERLTVRAGFRFIFIVGSHCVCSCTHFPLYLERFLLYFDGWELLSLYFLPQGCLCFVASLFPTVCGCCHHACLFPVSCFFFTDGRICSFQLLGTYPDAGIHLGTPNLTNGPRFLAKEIC